MNPTELRQSDEHHDRFFELADRIFLCVGSFSDPRISPSMAHMYSRKKMVRNALAMFTDALINKLRHEETPPLIRTSIDSQVRANTRSEYTAASETSVNALNRELKEPQRLVFYEWGMYEITTNERTGNYQQSNLALMVDMPDAQTLENFGQISLWLPPAGPLRVEFLQEREKPTKTQLSALGWREVSVGYTPERNVPVRGGFQAKRKQYSLKHIGALTINKSQGDTIVNGLAIEVSSDSTSPWEKAQVVVAFSRTKTASMTIIVGTKTYAINRLWDLITTPTQWTHLMENILDQVTINRSGGDDLPDFIDYPTYYPFRMCEARIPSDNTGIIYILFSEREPRFTYIGECEDLTKRMTDHNGGHGSFGTSNPSQRPFYPAGFISGLGHCDKAGRLSLESHWRYYRNTLPESADRFDVLNQGLRVVNYHNENQERAGRPERITFTRMVVPTST